MCWSMLGNVWSYFPTTSRQNQCSYSWGTAEAQSSLKKTWPIFLTVNWCFAATGFPGRGWWRCGSSCKTVLSPVTPRVSSTENVYFAELKNVMCEIAHSVSLFLSIRFVPLCANLAEDDTALWCAGGNVCGLWCYRVALCCRNYVLPVLEKLTILAT